MYRLHHICALNIIKSGDISHRLTLIRLFSYLKPRFVFSFLWNSRWRTCSFLWLLCLVSLWLIIRDVFILKEFHTCFVSFQAPALQYQSWWGSWHKFCCTWLKVMFECFVHLIHYTVLFSVCLKICFKLLRLKTVLLWTSHLFVIGFTLRLLICCQNSPTLRLWTCFQ